MYVCVLFITYKIIILMFINVDILYFLILILFFPTHLLSTMLARCPQSSHEQGSGSALTSVACAVPSSASARPIPKLTIKTKTCNDHWKICKNARFFKNMRTCNSKSMACDASFIVSFEPRCLCMLTLQ